MPSPASCSPWLQGSRVPMWYQCVDLWGAFCVPCLCCLMSDYSVLLNQKWFSPTCNPVLMRNGIGYFVVCVVAMCELVTYLKLLDAWYIVSMLTAMLNKKIKACLENWRISFDEMPTVGEGQSLLPEAPDVDVVAYVSRSVSISDRFWSIKTGF
jgi:hypothetical protein